MKNALLIALGLIPLARALNEALDAAAEISRNLGRRGPTHTTTHLGGWQLGALVGAGVGLGVVVDHQRGDCSIVDPARTEVVAYIGPVALTAVRVRLDEKAAA